MKHSTMTGWILITFALVLGVWVFTSHSSQADQTTSAGFVLNDSGTRLISYQGSGGTSAEVRKKSRIKNDNMSDEDFEKFLTAVYKSIESVMKNAPVAAIEDQTAEGFKVEKHPKFEVYADKAGEFRFRLKATNGQIIAVSEGYKAMKSCLNGIASVKKNAADAKIVKEEAKK